MKFLQNIPYGKMISYVVAIIIMAAITGYACAKGHYAYLIVGVPVMAFCIFRILKLYGEIEHRLMFVLNAVQNNDHSFRFAEDSRYTKYAFVNQSLNRIKPLWRMA